MCRGSESNIYKRGSDCNRCVQFTFLLDDIGIPANYRHMEGFGVHTYTLINKAGKVHYVKFHWLPTCGAHLCRLFGVCRKGGQAGV